MAMIETRTNAEGNTSFRVKVRVRGFPTQTATFARKTDAKEWGKQTEIAIKEGKYFKTAEAKKHTFKELVKRYLDYVELRNPRRHPWVKQYLAWWTEHLGDYALSEIGKTLIIEKRDKLLTGEKKRTNATVNRYMTALSHAFTIAINEWEWVQDHPMKKIAKLPEPRGRIRFLDEDERKRLLEACQVVDNDLLYLLVVLALSTGARHGELINLRWKDVDFKRNVIVLHDTKNKERRVLPLACYALELIKKHHAARNKATDLVFPAPRNPKEPWVSRPVWLIAVKNAGLDDFRFHDLRHSAASYLAMNGASLAEIAEVLGHKTLAMVKRYAHLSEAHTAGVVERMNQKIFG
ncbi:MAG: site-specific integrase [Pseudomonadota bacterium]|nr:site-specific integrase [Pseudomonadota bacterium]MDE3037566.1 site-specific integrase [Pseudomonadota bacterium]